MESHSAIVVPWCLDPQTAKSSWSIDQLQLCQSGCLLNFLALWPVPEGPVTSFTTLPSRNVYIVSSSSRGRNTIISRLSVQFSRSVLSDSLLLHELQHARPPCPSPTPGVYSNSCPLSRWCHPAISSSVSPSPPAPNPSQHQGFFRWVSSSHEVAKVLECQLQHPSFQWTPRMDLL